MDGQTGLFKSLFQSISAFCNAGFDLIGSNSMVPFVTNRIVCITCMMLTTIAGLGFLVWDDISNKINEGRREEYSVKRIIKNFSLHTKIVLVMQLILFLLGTLVFFGFEYNNMDTIGRFGFSDKLLISAFHSISARTAGFATVSMGSLTDITKIFFIILMLIGGASGGMAGGIKTTTLFVIIVGVYSNVIGKKNITVFKKTIPLETFMKAVSVAFVTIAILVVADIYFVAHSHINSIDLLFESVSAIATVGLTSGALEYMDVLCRFVVILLMYVGRIGTVTMAMSFVNKKPKVSEPVVYSKENIIVG